MLDKTQNNTGWQTLRVAHEFDRPGPKSRERVKCTIAEVEGRRFIDIRVFRYNAEVEEFRPTKRGLTLPIESIDELQLATTLLVEASENLS